MPFPSPNFTGSSTDKQGICAGQTVGGTLVTCVSVCVCGGGGGGVHAHMHSEIANYILKSTKLRVVLFIMKL